MSDTNNQENNQETASDQVPAAPTELELLKVRASMMNINFSNNIGVEALKAKINEKLEGTKAEDIQKDVLEDTEEYAPNALEIGAGVDPVAEKPESERDRMYRENMYLVRCRITNLNPNKKDLPGEIITVANEVLGTISKFIPFGEQTDEGYHIPKCLYDLLEARRFQSIRVTKDPRTGMEKVNTAWAREFALEVLPALTPAEIQNLAQAQIAAGSIDPNNNMNSL